MKELKDSLIEQGICPKYKGIISGDIDLNGLKDIGATPEGMEYIATHNYPTTPQLYRAYNGYETEYGVYVRKLTPQTLSSEGITTQIVSCNCLFNLPEWCVKNIAISRSSSIRVIVPDNTIAVIELYDDSILDLEASEYSKVSVFVYSHNAELHINSERVIIYKRYGKLDD